MFKPPADRPERLPAAWEPGQEESPGGGTTEEFSGALDARDIISFLWRRKVSLFVSFLAFLSGAAAYSQLAPEVYRSDVTFLVEAEGAADRTGGLDLLSQLGRGRQIETEIELIRSRRVLAPVLDSLYLSVLALDGIDAGLRRLLIRVGEELPEERHVLVAGRPGVDLARGDSSSSLEVLEADSERSVFEFAADSALVDLPVELAAGILDRAAWRSEMLRELGLRLTVGRVQRDADLIRLTCEGPTAVSARRICSSMEASYLEIRHDLERAHAATTRQLLTEQLSRIGKQVREAENQLAAYSRRNEAVALDDRASAEVRQQTDIQARRDVLESERASLAVVLDRVEEGGRLQYRELAAFPTFLGNETTTDLMATLLDLENRRSELTITRTEQSREVQAVDARVREIESQLHAMAISYERALAAQVSALDETIASMGQRLSTIPDRRIDYARLEREAANLAEVYAMLEGRMQEARIAESVNLPTVRVVDTATLPAKPSSPSLPLNLALGAIAGLAFGIGLAFVREQMDSGLRGRAQVELETGLSVLSMVPEVDRPGPVLSFSAFETAPPGRALVAGESKESRRIRQATEKAVALEAYRTLAVDLTFATRDGNGDGVQRGFHTLAVTSSTRGEGKTLTACNLAMVYAASGRRTLLVDTDLRASGVARFFGYGAGDPGLSDVLGERRYDPRSVRREVRVEGGEPLSLMLSGPPVRNSVRLFEEESFSSMLRAMEREFDLILFDTPPLSLITDAAAVAASVEGVLVVVRSGITEKEVLDYTLRRIRRVNGRVLGVVLNGVRPRDTYRQRYDYHRDRAAAWAPA